VGPDVVIYADTMRSPELRHEIPIGVPDPFLYAETGGERHAVVPAMELPRVSELDGITAHPLDAFGLDELTGSGKGRDEIFELVSARAVGELGIRVAVVPHTMSVGFADLLRGDGVELVVDREFFAERRRVKNEHEIAGIRRAQRAAEAGMRAAAELLRRATPSGGHVVLDGRPLTVERIKAAIAQAFIENDCTFDEFIVSHGAQSAVGHHMGAGPVTPGAPIVIDIWPRDTESACFADMTRTFVVGEPPAELVEWHRLCLEALQRGVAESRPGARGRAVYDGTCEIFERAGYPTQRTKEAGKPLEDGFFHGLGHGVGLEVHEAPNLGLLGQDTLVAGDVVTVEPGLYRPDVGGCRLEDLVLVTEDGPENLTDFPYDLQP
jgi:Xaa-Pro aminopeptidase